jgi:hypothetical protein
LPLAITTPAGSAVELVVLVLALVVELLLLLLLLPQPATINAPSVTAARNEAVRLVTTFSSLSEIYQTDD